MFSGLAGRIRVAAIFLSLAPLVCGGVLLIFLSVSANRTEASQLQAERAARAAKTIDAYLLKLRSSIEQVSRTYDLPNLPHVAQERILGSLSPNSASAFQEVRLLDKNGKVLATAGIPPPDQMTAIVDAAVTQVRGEALVGSTAFSAIYQNSASRQAEIVVAGPAYDADNAPAGLVYARVDLRYMEQVVDQLGIGMTGYTYIVDGQGAILARKNAHIDLNNRQSARALPPVAAFIRTGRMAETAVFPAKTYEGLSGAQVLGSYFPFEATNWAIVVELPTNEVDAPLFQMILVLVGAFLLTLALVVLAALVVVRWLVRPLQVLKQGAEEVSAGNYHVRIEELDTNDELDYLARAFNHMVQSLETNQAALEKQVVKTDKLFRDTAERAARLEVLIETSRAVSSVLDPDSLYSIMAEQVRRVVNYDWLGLALPGEAGAMLRIAYSSTTSGGAGIPGYTIGANLPIGSGPDLVYRSCQPIIVADTADANALYATISLREAGFRAFVAVPIERNREVLGVLIASSRSANAFNDDQRDLLSAIGVQLAIALNNSRVYQRLRQAYSDLDHSVGGRNQTARLP